jgi:hypothetical protein
MAVDQAHRHGGWSQSRITSSHFVSDFLLLYHKFWW